MRTPSLRETLAVFNSCHKEKMDAVVDVGVQVKTEFLMASFPDAHHFLFEPVALYHDMIRNAYTQAGISHTLLGQAVSDQAGVMYQHILSSDMSGRATHSQLLLEKNTSRFGKRLLDIIETEVVALDAWAEGKLLGANYVVKLDVDGLEDKIIAGGRKLIAGAALVIVEADMNNLAGRVKVIQDLGHKLFDIAGNGYYFGQLQQVDLVFVANRVVAGDIDFRPWAKMGGEVVWDAWQQYV